MHVVGSLDAIGSPAGLGRSVSDGIALPVKILHVISWLAPRYGGPVTLLPQSCTHLAALGNETEVVTTNVDGHGVLDVPTGRPIDWKGASVTFHAVSWPRGFLTSWPMLADLRQRTDDFDVVHIHYLYRFHTIVAALVARCRGVPYVIQPHGCLDSWHRARKRRAKDLYHWLIEDRIIRGAAVICCTSMHEMRSLRDLGYTVPAWVIPIGVDFQELRKPAPTDDFLAAMGVGQQAKVVTFLGRLSAKKGVELLVDSFRLTAEAFPDARLIVAGPDDEGIAWRLRPVVAASGLSDRVSFIGLVGGPEKRALLQRSQVFVLASADESFGIAVVEAMAVGCPVVISPYVAVEDLVRSAGAGLIAERDPTDIARAVGTILANPEEAAAMGEAAKRAAEETFAWPRVAAQLVSMYEAVGAAGRTNAGPPASLPRSATRPTGLEGLQLVCPLCHEALRFESDAFACARCEQTYPLIDGIPVLAPDMTMTEHDEIEHLHRGRSHDGHGDDHKARQAAHFDRAVAEEFEITRPHGTPALYRFFLREKFRRATAPIGPHLVGATALTVCGGSGMDAEFLARAGARVVASDLSLGAAQRTRERACRYGLDITPIVADVERLPFADADIDLVLVHDGLHHLERLELGLGEMARVARRWVSVTEPAHAAVTAAAVKLGLALVREEAGNRVARLKPKVVGQTLRLAGFRPLIAERYAMYYRHEPKAVLRALSRPGVFPVVRDCWRAANALAGAAGNKMVVVAEREVPPEPPR